MVKFEDEKEHALRRLVKVYHIADVVPRELVVLQVAVVVYPTGAIVGEEPDQGRVSRATVKPDGQGCRLGVDISGFEEPKEDVLIGGYIYISARSLVPDLISHGGKDERELDPL